MVGQFYKKIICLQTVAISCLIYLIFLILSYKQSAEEFTIPMFNTDSVNRSSNQSVSAAVVLSLSRNESHIVEFSLLYDSWRFIQNFSPLSDDILLDLIVFCEQPSCYQLPSSCLPLSMKTKFHKQNQCFYEELKIEIIAEWQSYLYMTSIAFMLTDEYKNVMIYYQWILRVDQDALLSPALFFALKQQHSTPLYSMQFGGIYHGIEFTHQRLKTIAKKLGYKHAGIHNLCSTWLVNPQDSIQLANLTTKIGKYFIENEFGKHIQGLENLPYVGEWPKWWYGVISLYAAEIAINHYYFSRLTKKHGLDTLDHPSYSKSSIWSIWHIHCLHNPVPFDKFKHRDDLRIFFSKSKFQRIQLAKNNQNTQMILKKIISEYQHFQLNQRILRGRITVQQYVTALAWQKAYSASAAINV